MSDTVSVGIVGVIAILVVVGLFLWLFRGRKTSAPAAPAGAKPEWMRSTPPQETVAAVQTGGGKMALYGHEQGEKLASPFAEQIEDIVRAKMAADPQLKAIEIDFGTAPDGQVEFIIAGGTYTAVEQIPDERIKAIVKQSIEAYNQQK